MNYTMKNSNNNEKNDIWKNEEKYNPRSNLFMEVWIK